MRTVWIVLSLSLLVGTAGITDARISGPFLASTGGAPAAACPHDGNPLTETWDGPTADNTWVYTPGVPPPTSTTASGFALSGAPPACAGTGGMHIRRANELLSSTYYSHDLGSDVSNGWINAVDIVLFFSFGSDHAYADNNTITPLFSVSNNAQMSFNTAAQVNLQWIAGSWHLLVQGVYVVSGIVITNWHGLALHLDPVAASSEARYDSNGDGDFSDETPVAFTRADFPVQYIHTGVHSGSGAPDPADVFDIKVGYASIRTP